MTEEFANPPDNDDWLSRVWQSAPPPEPGEAAWAGVLARIQTHVPTEGARIRRPNRSRSWLSAWAGGLATVAAAVLLVVFIQGFWRGGSGPVGLPIEPWPVASEDDVEIISMDTADYHALVVGQPPFRGPLVLANAGEVLIDDTGHDVEVRVPEDWKVGQPSSPMFIMPLDSGTGK